MSGGMQSYGQQFGSGQSSSSAPGNGGQTLTAAQAMQFSQHLQQNPRLLQSMISEMQAGKLNREQIAVLQHAISNVQRKPQGQQSQPLPQQQQQQQQQQPRLDTVALQAQSQTQTPTQSQPQQQTTEEIQKEVRTIIENRTKLQGFLTRRDVTDESKQQAKERFSTLMNMATPTVRQLALQVLKSQHERQQQMMREQQQAQLQTQPPLQQQSQSSSQQQEQQIADIVRKRQRSSSIQPASPAPGSNSANSPARLKGHVQAAGVSMNASASAAGTPAPTPPFPKAEPESGPPARPTLSQGLISSTSLSTPAIPKPPSAIASRKEDKDAPQQLQEMLETIDPGASLDQDVEELLLEVTDEFIESVTRFACRLAQHRHSERLEAQDVALHLERNWNMHLPGWNFSHEGTESARLQLARKSNLPQSYLQRVNAVKEAQQRRR